MASLEITEELYDSAKKMRADGEVWKEEIPAKLRNALALIEECGKEEGIGIIVDAAKEISPVIDSNVKMYESYFDTLIDTGRFLQESYESMNGSL